MVCRNTAVLVNVPQLYFMIVESSIPHGSYNTLLFHNHMDPGFPLGKIKITVPGHCFVGQKKDHRCDHKKDSPGDDEPKPVAGEIIKPRY